MRVIDTDPHSVRTCLAKGVDAALDDALAPHLRGDEDVVCFKLIQHHLVGPDEAATLALQRQALAAWRPRARAVFVNEYIYDSHFATLSGRLIYEITSNRALSALASVLNRVVPSLRANTGPAWACWPWYGATAPIGWRPPAHASWPSARPTCAAWPTSSSAAWTASPGYDNCGCVRCRWRRGEFESSARAPMPRGR